MICIWPNLSFLFVIKELSKHVQGAKCRLLVFQSTILPFYSARLMLTQQPIRFAHYLPTDKTCQLANNKAGALFV